MPKITIITQNAPSPIGHYSQGIIARNFVFVSGQLSLDSKTGNIVPGDIRVQTKYVLDNIKAILEQAGCTMDDVVKTTVFIDNLDNFKAMNEVYQSYFSRIPPARSTVVVGQFPPEIKVEIEAIAMIP
jgi:2-iminobutanoate/2-iminopropanoate deaminase